MKKFKLRFHKRFLSLILIIVLTLTVIISMGSLTETVSAENVISEVYSYEDSIESTKTFKRKKSTMFLCMNMTLS